MAEALDMAALAHEHTAWIQQIWAANDDLAQRMATLGVTSQYDPDLDILFTRIGPAVEALTESVGDRIGLRVDPDTLKIVGWEVLEPRAASQSIAALAALMFALLAVTDFRDRPQAEPARVRLYTQLADDLRQLALAA